MEETMTVGNFRRLPWLILGIIALTALAAIGCTKEVQVPGETVIETVVVEKEVPGAKVVETVVVEKEVPGAKVIETVVVEKEVEVVATATPAPTAAPKPAGPVIWTIGFPEDITSLNIWDIIGPAATAYNFYAMLNQYPSLMALSDQRFDYVPMLADGFPGDAVQEGDFWTVTVPLRNDVVWTDGEAVDANDFVFTVDTARDFELGGNWAGNVDPDVVDHAEAVDPYTLKVYFKSAPGLSRWQFGLALQSIVPEHYWAPIVAEVAQEATLEDRQAALYNYQPVGEPKAGELVFQKWEPGAFIALEKNQTYYWQDSTVVEYASGAYAETVQGETFTAYGEAGGDVALELTRTVDADAVDFSVFSSQDAAILALRSAEIDYFLSPLGLSAGLKQQVLGQPGISVIQNPSNGFRFLNFNMRATPMSDVAFRQAVATLIDKEFLCEKILQNAAIPINTNVPAGNGFWYNPDVPLFGTGDTREERINDVVTLLTAAGYSWDSPPAWNADSLKVTPGEGLRGTDGELIRELELLAPSAGYDPLRATSGIWIEQWLKEAGIPVKANLTGFNVIVPKVMEEQDYDMFILGFGLNPFPDHLADFYHSDASDPYGWNFGGYNNPEFDALADTFRAETDLTAAREQAFALQEMLAEDVPTITLFSVPVIEAFRSDTMNFAYTDVLDGVQNYFQNMNGPLSHTALE